MMNIHWRPRDRTRRKPNLMWLPLHILLAPLTLESLLDRLHLLPHRLFLLQFHVFHGLLPHLCICSVDLQGTLLVSFFASICILLRSSPSLLSTKYSISLLSLLTIASLTYSNSCIVSFDKSLFSFFASIYIFLDSSPSLVSIKYSISLSFLLTISSLTSSLSCIVSFAKSFFASICILLGSSLSPFFTKFSISLFFLLTITSLTSSPF
ncbi:hypothetical protein CR513_00459, partial [Mucuna pruriens]